MALDENSMARVVELLGETYSPSGVALWLDARNLDLGDERPIVLCGSDAGRLRVLALAEQIADGNA